MLYGGMRESEAGAEIEIKVRKYCLFERIIKRHYYSRVVSALVQALGPRTIFSHKR